MESRFGAGGRFARGSSGATEMFDTGSQWLASDFARRRLCRAAHWAERRKIQIDGLASDFLKALDQGARLHLCRIRPALEARAPGQWAAYADVSIRHRLWGLTCRELRHHDHRVTLADR